MITPGVLRGGIVRNIVIAADTGAADAQVLLFFFEAKYCDSVKRTSESVKRTFFFFY